MTRVLPLGFLFVVLFVSACDTSEGDGANEESRAEGDTTVTVEAQANVFAAGLSGAPGLFRGGGGLPAEVAVFEEDTTVVFAAVEGTVTSNANLFDPHSPDGGPPGLVNIVPCEESPDCNGIAGISGIMHEEAFLFFAGVFLSDAAPASPAPASLDVTNANGRDAFSAPELGQVFFIGDGRSADGTVQRFRVPAGATRLYLGFPDTDTPAEPGPPSSYGDNEGALDVVYRFNSAN